MAIKVKRNTGIMGGASKVVLMVDEKVEKKLKNNEEHVITTAKDSITLKAKQWFFGSNGLKVNENDNVEIKINPMCMTLFVLSIALVFIAGISESREIKLIFGVGGLASIAVTLVYSVKSWFILKNNMI